MSLSSFTQYYIRKLLRQQLKSVDGRVPCSPEIYRYLQADLNQILAESSATIEENFVVAQKIEALVQAHRERQSSGLYDHQFLFKLEQEIFELIGLRLYLTTPAILLRVVEETAVCPFNFFLHRHLCKGIRHKNRMYGLALIAKPKYDPYLHQLIALFMEQEIDFLLTASHHHHALWINLKSPAYVAFINYGSRLLNKTASLQTILHRCRKIQSTKRN
jgi:hypothetical protein